MGFGLIQDSGGGMRNGIVFVGVMQCLQEQRYCWRHNRELLVNVTRCSREPDPLWLQRLNAGVADEESMFQTTCST